MQLAGRTHRNLRCKKTTMRSRLWRLTLSRNIDLTWTFILYRSVTPSREVGLKEKAVFSSGTCSFLSGPSFLAEIPPTSASATRIWMLQDFYCYWNSLAMRGGEKRSQSCLGSNLLQSWTSFVVVCSSLFRSVPLIQFLPLPPPIPVLSSSSFCSLHLLPPSLPSEARSRDVPCVMCAWRRF